MALSLKKIFTKIGDCALNTLFYGFIAAGIGLSATTLNYYHHRDQHQPSQQELKIEQEHQIEILGEPNSGELMDLDRVLDEKEIKGPLTIEYVSDNLLERHAVDLLKGLTLYGYYKTNSHLPQTVLISHDRETLIHELAHHTSLNDKEKVDHLVSDWLRVAQERELPDYYTNTRLTSIATHFGIKLNPPLPQEQLLERGFIQNYGQTNYREDIATLATAIDTLPFDEIEKMMENNSTLIHKALVLQDYGIANLGKRVLYDHLVKDLDSRLSYEGTGYYTPKNYDPERWHEELSWVLGRIDNFITAYPKSEEADRLREFRDYVVDPKDFLLRWEVRQDYEDQEDFIFQCETTRRAGKKIDPNRTVLREIAVLESTTPEQKTHYDSSYFNNPMARILKQDYFYRN